MVDTRQFANDDDKNLLSVEGALQANTILQNRYRIEGVLGVGGMGSVYRARDLQFPEAKRYVAVKEMLHHTNDPQLRDLALKNFRREANILAGLNHPAIPTIHDYFATKERAYLVMEYIDGSDLDHVLTRSEDFLPIPQVVEWSIALCDVLHYLHSGDPPIVFRDVKPSNLMIDQFQRLRLIDFGIAKHFEPDAGKGTMIGTEGYAAPESYRGLANPGSDVFGVGATLHHLLTRHDPRLEAPFTFGERAIRDTNPNVSPQLDAIVMKALAFSPDERFKDAEEMKKALISVLANSGHFTTSVPGGGTAMMNMGKNETETWGDISSSSGIEPRWVFKAEEEIRSTPVVHKGMVYVTVYDNNLYTLDAETGDLKWKYATEHEIASSPAIAEEDGVIVFGSKDTNVYAVDMRSGKIRWTCQTQAPIYSSPAIKHGHIFIGSDDGYLYAIRIGTGRVAWKANASAPIRSKPAVTDDRVVVGAKSGELLCLDLGGQPKWRFKARREIMSSPAVGNGIVYVGSMDGHLYAVDMANGWSAWKFQTNRPVVSSPLLVGDMVYVGTVSGIMYCLDSGGRERWKIDVGEQITSSPAYFDGAIYFGANNKKVYSLDAKNGKERWSYTTEGIVPGSPYVVDGTVYIGSADHHLYAFKA